jgi:hypothetical protein
MSTCYICGKYPATKFYHHAWEEKDISFSGGFRTVKTTTKTIDYPCCEKCKTKNRKYNLFTIAISYLIVISCWLPHQIKDSVQSGQASVLAYILFLLISVFVALLISYPIISLFSNNTKRKIDETIFNFKKVIYKTIIENYLQACDSSDMDGVLSNIHNVVVFRKNEFGEKIFKKELEAIFLYKKSKYYNPKSPRIEEIKEFVFIKPNKVNVIIDLKEGDQIIESGKLEFHFMEEKISLIIGDSLFLY